MYTCMREEYTDTLMLSFIIVLSLMLELQWHVERLHHKRTPHASYIDHVTTILTSNFDYNLLLYIGLIRHCHFKVTDRNFLFEIKTTHYNE